MPARGDEDEKGEGDAVRQSRGQRVRLEVVDGDERLAARQRDPLARHQPNKHAADEAGTCCRGHSVEILGRDFGPRQRARDQ